MARRVLHDKYFKQAKAEGYLARSAYKLKQIQEKRGLLRRGMRVLDIGCAPGSWLQVASEIVGEQGIVVGIDLKEVEAPMPANVRTIQGDAFVVPPDTLIAMANLDPAAGMAPGGRFDAVISDMMPDTTGAGDHYRSVEACRRLLRLLPQLLRAGGVFAMKVFEGEEYPGLLKESATHFREARGFKPDATRAMSVEMYITGIGYRPPQPPQPPKPPTGGAGPAGGKSGKSGDRA
jgi:23S rRNA (uridine2552-2'-O)-methyltransferase